MSPSYRWRLQPNNRWITSRSAGAPVEPVGSQRVPMRGDGEPAPLHVFLRPRFFFANQEPETMTLIDRTPRDTLREGSTPVLETERLVLRAPRFEDAKRVAALVNDRRIAENTARIPHPYGIADANEWIGAAILQFA